MAPAALRDLLKAQDQNVAYFQDHPNELHRFALAADTGADAFVLPYYSQSMCGAQAPPAVDRDGLLIVPAPWCQAAGWARFDVKRHRIVDLLHRPPPGYDPRAWANYLGKGNADECVGISTAGPLVFNVHSLEWEGISGMGVFNLESRRWLRLPTEL